MSAPSKGLEGLRSGVRHDGPGRPGADPDEADGGPDRAGGRHRIRFHECPRRLLDEMDIG